MVRPAFNDKGAELGGTETAWPAADAASSRRWQWVTTVKLTWGLARWRAS